MHKNLEKINGSTKKFSEQAKTYAKFLPEFSSQEWQEIENHAEQRLVIGGATLMEAVEAMTNSKK